MNHDASRRRDGAEKSPTLLTNKYDYEYKQQIRHFLSKEINAMCLSHFMIERTMHIAYFIPNRIMGSSILSFSDIFSSVTHCEKQVQVRDPFSTGLGPRDRILSSLLQNADFFGYFLN